MPKFAANLTTMFTELEVHERFAAARGAGFTAVEFLAPYRWPSGEVRQWLSDASLSMILLNTQPGDSTRGEVGLAALPGRETEFRASFELSLSYADELGASMIHLLAGRTLDNMVASEDTFIDNVRWAADLAADKHINVLLEPLNTQDVPGYLHTRSDHTADLIDEIDRANVRMQFDFYHMQIMEGNLAAQISRHFDKIGHIQFSSVPGRYEPQYGEVNVSYLFEFLDEIGYAGWVGCEYSAKSSTLEGLGWGKPYGLG